MDRIRPTEYELTTRDGLRLVGSAWEPAGHARAVICLVHGFGEHTGRYSRVAEFMAERGWAVLASDQRGHGRSPGRRGSVPSYKRLLDDIDAMLWGAASHFPALPVFLYGHSMGGGEVLHYALVRQPGVAGVIATSPWLELSPQPPLWQLALTRFLSTLAPGLPLPRQLDHSRLSHDEAVVRAYNDDPLVHHRITARLFFGCYRAGMWSMANAGQLKVPVLLVHGSGDRITSCEATRQFAARSPQFCTIRVWDGLLHELHNEPEWHAVLEYVAGWVESRLPHPESDGPDGLEASFKPVWGGLPPTQPGRV